MTTISDLRLRVEKASGPDRELDCLIEAAIIHKTEIVWSSAYWPRRPFANPLKDVDWIGYDLLNTSPAYTASLDAVVALIERVMPTWHWTLYDTDGNGNPNAQMEPPTYSYEPFNGSGITPPLALLAAFLAALEAKEKTNARD